MASEWIRRPLELAAAALACVVLYLTGVLSHASFPSILIALAVAAVFGSLAQRRLSPNTSPVGLYGWIGLHLAGITAAIYASGWGPVLAIGYVFPASELLQVVGRGAMLPVAVWALLGILAGELAIGLGLAPSAIGAPLAHHVAVVGAIALMLVLRLVSVNVGEKDHALELLRHALLRLNVLHALGQQVLSRLQADDLFDLATRQAQSLLQPCTALLVLVDGQDAPRYASAHGEHAALFLGRRLTPRGLQERVMRSARHLLTDDPLAEGWADPETAGQMRLRSLVASPINIHGEVVGCLTALRTIGQPLFAQDDLLLLDLFADYVSLALEHARIYDQLRERADRDSLTQLYNHRAVMEQLDRSLALSRRSGTNMSILMIDIDAFKAVNDTFGHQAGDAVLRELGRRLQNCVRASDSVGRYGGEEFLAILPDTSQQGALAVAQRLHEGISAAPFAVDQTTSVPIAVSIGVASWPSHGSDRQALIAAADLALYEAKRLGGGRTVAAAAHGPM